MTYIVYRILYVGICLNSRCLPIFKFENERVSAWVCVCVCEREKSGDKKRDSFLWTIEVILVFACRNPVSTASFLYIVHRLWVFDVTTLKLLTYSAHLFIFSNLIRTQTNLWMNHTASFHPHQPYSMIWW